MVMATPIVVLNLATGHHMATNAGPIAMLPTGTNDQQIIRALTTINPASLIPATTPQQLESAFSTSSVWGTVIVMLTNTVVPSTIAGGPYTNIKIRVDEPNIPPSGTHRAFLRQKHSCSASIPTYRVSPVLPRYPKFLFLLINPRRLPAPPPRTVPSNQQFGRISHTKRRRHPRIARAGSPVCLFPYADCI